VFGQFSGKEEFHGSLNFSERKGSLLIVSNQLRRLNSDSIENVIDERIHDAHGFLRDSSLRVHLLQHLIDVNGESLYSPLVSLGGGFFHGFGYGLLLGWHFYYFIIDGIDVHI
jgi:hypothetical protein